MRLVQGENQAQVSLALYKNCLSVLGNFLTEVSTVTKSEKILPALIQSIFPGCRSWSEEAGGRCIIQTSPKTVLSSMVVCSLISHPTPSFFPPGGPNKVGNVDGMHEGVLQCRTLFSFWCSFMVWYIFKLKKNTKNPKG